nr:putative capsid [Marmot picobirnavirus]
MASRNNNYKRNKNIKGKTQNKGGQKQRTRDNAEYTSEDLKDSRNDVSWYSTDPNILRDAASIPFSWSVGTAIYDVFDTPVTIPGLMVQYLVPSIGYTESITDPVNLASTSLYSFIRHANSGHVNYDDLDLTVMIVCASSVYSFINWAQRIYGLAFMYAQRNRYMPNAIFEAENIDAHDIVEHLADFRYGINVLINKMASIWVPANMTIFSRQAFLYQNIYCEGPSIKDQLYMYSPYGFYIHEFDKDGAGCARLLALKSIHPDASKLKTSDILWLGNHLLDALLDQEDIGIMCGDIYKAYGDGGIIKLAPLPEMYLVAPVYDQAVLTQMKNATTLDIDVNVVLPDKERENFAVVQDDKKSHLIHKPHIPNVFEEDEVYNWYVRLMRRSRLITIDAEDITPDMIMESSRLMFSVDPCNDVTLDKFGAMYTGSEIVMSCKVFQMDAFTGACGMCPCDTVTFYQPDVPWLAAVYAAWNHFKYHPFARVAWASNADQQALAPAFDVDNYGVLSHTDIQRLNEAALLNEFGMHGIAKVIR